MKVLYAIQGTGNGHICRAHDVVRILRERCEPDVLISGTQCDIELPYPVKYRMNGLSFVFGKKGGVDLMATYRKSRVKQLMKEVDSLPVEEYDLVISDFEPVSSWACVMKTIPCISLSHQSAVINKKSPQPKHIDPVGKAILKLYAPATVHYGYHFKPYAENIFTPVIRQEIRNQPVNNDEHYTVYLPAYSDKRILRYLSKFPTTKWHVFSKHFTEPAAIENITLSPVNNNEFIRSMASSKGVLCGAGFETPAEALYMKKKLMVIPMKNQFEQHCNAAALKEMGVPVIKSLKEKHISKIEAWLSDDTRIEVDYPDQTAAIIDLILRNHAATDNFLKASENSESISAKDFRKLTLKNILYKLAN